MTTIFRTFLYLNRRSWQHILMFTYAHNTHTHTHTYIHTVCDMHTDTQNTTHTHTLQPTLFLIKGLWLDFNQLQKRKKTSQNLKNSHTFWLYMFQQNLLVCHRQRRFRGSRGFAVCAGTSSSVRWMRTTSRTSSIWRGLMIKCLTTDRFEFLMESSSKNTKRHSTWYLIWSQTRTSRITPVNQI